jgi:hypothetical protein
VIGSCRYRSCARREPPRGTASQPKNARHLAVCQARFS